MNFHKSSNKAPKFSPLSVIFLCGFLPGCCLDNLHQEPAYPNDAQIGWKEKEAEQKGLQVRGVFLLKKGEASDNGEIQVKVTDIIANDPCDSRGLNSLPKAVLQLSRVADHKVLCTGTYTEKAYGILPGDCGKETAELGVSGFRIYAINLSRGWVFFELHG
jgi:hypothetical protein